MANNELNAHDDTFTLLLALGDHGVAELIERSLLDSGSGVGQQTQGVLKVMD